MYGRCRSRQGPLPSMNDDPSPPKLGLTDAELAVQLAKEAKTKAEAKEVMEKVAQRKAGNK